MKQKVIPGLGELIDSLYTTLPILSIINFLSIITVLYANIREYLLAWTPWLEFWMFISILVALTGTLVSVIWKFVIPSLWAHRGRQIFGHQSDISDKLDEILRRLDALEEEKKDNVSNESKQGKGEEEDD